MAIIVCNEVSFDGADIAFSSGDGKWFFAEEDKINGGLYKEPVDDWTPIWQGKMRQLDKGADARARSERIFAACSEANATQSGDKTLEVLDTIIKEMVLTDYRELDAAFNEHIGLKIALGGELMGLYTLNKPQSRRKKK
jgi:hypothetical protein